MISEGQQFGNLQAIRFSHMAGHQRMWFFKCECGTEFVTAVHRVRKGTTRSCGCLARRLTGERARIHGHSAGGKTTPEFKSWMSMLARCERETDPGYPRYGGRGIAVCERWHSFENFFADMGTRPKDRTLDRIDNDGNYEPGNCRWATKAEQTVNRRSTKFVIFNGSRTPLAEAIRQSGVNKHWVYWRVEHCDMDHQQAFDAVVAKHMSGCQRVRGSDGKYVG